MSVNRSSQKGRDSKETRIKARKISAGQTRSFALFVSFIVIGVLVVARLGYLQIYKADDYSEMAKEQRTRDIELSARRGTIYDRNGEVLAVSITAKTIYTNPAVVKKPEEIAGILAESLGGSVEDYLPKLTKEKSKFAYIKRKVDSEVAAKLEKKLADKDLAGIYFLDDTKRVYPDSETAGQIVGFIDIEEEGRAGLESYYDDLLHGQKGELLVERAKDGSPIPGGVIKEVPAKDGKDIRISISKEIQDNTQKVLAEAVEQWGAKSGSAVVMNPKNGEIYAIASTPYYDPNKYGEAKPEAISLNPIANAYEPGSTFKAITAAAALDKGVFTVDSPFSIPSSFQIYDQVIHDSSPHGTLQYTFKDIITHSSNIGTAKIATALGGENLYNYIVSFGLTQKTGVDFPGGTKGVLAPYNSWYGTTYANVSFGQGISVSTLQLARAVSAIANDGILTTPHFLIDTPGQAYSTEWAQRRVISSTAAKATNEVLISSGNKGTRNQAKVEGYTIAGKTGTAQKANENGVGYSPDKYVGSFIGYLPAEDPQLLVYVILDEPSSAYYGVTVSTPAFNKIATFAADSLKIPYPNTKKTTDQKATTTP